MGIFDEILKDKGTIFQDEIALDFDYIPKVLKHRENEQKYVASCITPLLQGRSGKNLFITGKPGIGKTAAVRWVLRELEQETSEVHTIYINCWKTNTAFKILNEICQQIGYRFVQNKNTEELLKDVASIINKNAAVFVLDEVDKLEEESIIYALLEDIFRKTIILITNEKEFLAKLDSRIKSRLLPETLEFREYNYEELKDILEERKRYAFFPNVWDNEAFKLIVDKTFEFGDVRVGLDLMRKSGLIAEEKSSKKIYGEIVKEAIKKLDTFKLGSSDSLVNEKKKILNLIKSNSGKSIKELHEIFKNQLEMPYRTFFRKIKELEKEKLITTEEATGPGRSTLVYYGTKFKNLKEFEK